MINSFGIRNMGNTCYLNSVLQSLLSFDSLHNFLVSNDVCNQDSISKKFIDIFLLSRDKNFDSKSIIPTSLYKVLCSDFKSDFFKNRFQQDSHEFYLIFLDIIENDFKKKAGLFYGSYNVILECVCGEKKSVIEEFNSMCLPGFFKQEVIEDYKCEKCNFIGSTTKSFSIKKLPDILTVQVNRFEKNSTKNKRPFVFEERMYNIYSLSSIILHSGDSLSSGHYYNVSKRNGGWVCFNDSSVSLFDISEVNKEEIYMLFYTRIKN